MKRLPRLLATALVLTSFPSPASADLPIVVNSKQDLPDADLGDGTCDADLAAPGLQITLRAAIMHANAVAGTDTIEIPKGKFKLKRKTAGVDSDATGDLDVTDDTIIIGAGAKQTIIDGKKLGDRLFQVDGKILTLRNLTIRNGHAIAPDDDGGGVSAKNNAHLNIFDCTIMNNRADEAGGGILCIASELVFENVLVTKNRADVVGGGVVGANVSFVALEESAFVKNKCKGGDGGALYIVDSPLFLINSTVSGNKAARGGGLWTAVGHLGGVRANGCTFAKNKATSAGSGVFEDTTALPDVDFMMSNSIMANNAATNYAGDMVDSLGGNIDTGTTCGFGAVASDQENTNPKLGKLKKNGGPTPTHALPKNSPAIDRAVDMDALPEDQRGVLRFDVPNKGTSVADVGAFEFRP